MAVVALGHWQVEGRTLSEMDFKSFKPQRTWPKIVNLGKLGATFALRLSQLEPREMPRKSSNIMVAEIILTNALTM